MAMLKWVQTTSCPFEQYWVIFGDLWFAIGAAAINKVIASQTVKEGRKCIEDWVKAPKISALGVVTSNALITGSSLRFNVYGNDFGWGRPIAVRSGAGNKFYGKLTVFPGVEEGSMDFEACLSPETLQAMIDDSESMETFAS
nr:putative acetyltransferase [Quercus suber]